MRLVSRSSALNRGLVSLTLIAGVFFIPKQVLAQG